MSLITASSPRFAFGENWHRFLSLVSEPRIKEAEKSLVKMLGVESLPGRSFLDVGCGSGLFSLAAMRLGATRVHSFDFDQQCVACAQQLKMRFFPGAQQWTIEEGSVLDVDYLRGLGRWDIVYSWGVLHHTGAMWQALSNVVPLVNPQGLLFTSIYNDQGWRSRCWTRVKAFYNQGRISRMLCVGVFIPCYAVAFALTDLASKRNPMQRYRNANRGMSPVYDWLDWLGGYPFEVSKPEGIIDFYQRQGFKLRKLHTCGSRSGCNEFLFER